MPFGIIGSAIGGIGSAIGGGKSADAATDAARIQTQAANNATELQKNVLQTMHNELAPYRDIGTNPDIYNQYVGRTLALGSALPGPLQVDLSPFATSAVTNGPAQTGVYTTPQTAPAVWDPTLWGPGANLNATLQQTPGYQFTLDQGLRGVQNAAAAQGRGVSGNALTGAAQYATGLANQTFKDQFQQQQQNQAQNFLQGLGSQQQMFTQGLANANLGLQGQQQQFAQNLAANAQNLGNYLQAQGINYQQAQNNLLLPIQTLANAINVGQSATTGGAQIGASLIPGIANTITGAGAAGAAGVIGANNASVGGLQGLGNSLSNYALLNGGIGGGSGGFGDFFNNLFGFGSGSYGYNGGSGTGGLY